MHIGGLVSYLSARICFKKCFFIVSLFLLASCSDRDLQINYLNKILGSAGDFKITNTQNENDLVGDEEASALSVNMVCGKSIIGVEIQDPTTHVWKSVQDVGGASLNCDGATTNAVPLPLAVIAPYSAPTASGDRRQDFQIRWKVKDLEGSTLVYYRTLSALFKAPTFAVTFPAVNIANSDTNQYSISGTCSGKNGASIAVTGLASSTLTFACSSGVFAGVVTPDVNLPQGRQTLHVKHYSQDLGSGLARTYAEKDFQVLVDKVAPLVQVTSPVTGLIYNTETIHLQGTCSESLLPLTVIQGGSAVPGVFTCSAAGTFSIEVNAPEGSSSYVVSQMDEAGNTGSSVLISIVKDRTPPGSFSVEGVTSIGGVDTVKDAILSDNGLTVNWTLAAGATKYNVVIKDNSGTEICVASDVSVNYVEMASCSLAQSGSYKIYITAFDSIGNSSGPANDGFSFTTQFPIPKIVKIYTDAIKENGVYTTGATIPIYVQFDRAIVFTGSNVKINLNSSAVVTATSIAGGSNGKALLFPYTVAANQLAEKLSVTGFSGTVFDQINQNVSTTPMIPNDTGTDPNLLMAKNIKIDSVPPNPVTGLTIGVIPQDLSLTPPIFFSPPSGDVVTVFARVIDNVTSAEMEPWTPIISGTSLRISSGEMKLGTAYRIEVRTKDMAENYGSTVMWTTYMTKSCSAGFIYLQNPFGAPINYPMCVSQFEAKGSASSPVFDALGVPIAASQSDARSACVSLGARLITSQEWNVIADLILRQPQNWTGAVIGSGLLKRGNILSGNLPAEVHIADPCYPSDCSSDASLSRKHVLPYHQDIWDFSGNSAEITDGTSSAFYSPYDNDYVISLATGGRALAGDFGTSASNTCTNSVSAGYCGYGRLNFSGVGNVVWRGGAVGEGDGAGAFAAVRVGSATDLYPGGLGTFRCVHDPR